MTDFELGWTAGILDGEGHVTLLHRRRDSSWRAVVAVNNTDPAMIMRLCQLWDGRMNLIASDRYRPGRKPIHRWTVESQRALRVLDAVMPHLVTKRQVAELVIAFQRRLDSREGRLFFRRNAGRFIGSHLTPQEREVRSAMVQQVRLLNRRGV